MLTAIKTMAANITAIALTLLVAIGFYEGLPFLNRIPWIENIPGIGDLALGRVEIVRRAEAKACETEKANMVDKSVLAATLAVADRERDLRIAAQAEAAISQRAAAEDRAAREKSDERYQALVKEAAGATGLTYPSEEDLQWSSEH